VSPYAAALTPYAYKSTTFCAKKWRFDDRMMGKERGKGGKGGKGEKIKR